MPGIGWPICGTFAGGVRVGVGDVNGDGKPDVIIAYESSGSTMLSARDGSIHVYLNRGATPTAKAAAKPEG